jgi:hypothetical protein
MATRVRNKRKKEKKKEKSREGNEENAIVLPFWPMEIY